MTVGKALAEARTRAGLTVDEVSERTRIREKIIRGIEGDDYEACGGDLFARGYVRVIADVVGVDAQPLIREYDQSRQRGAATATSPVPPVPPEPPARTDSPEPESGPHTPPAESGTAADEPPTESSSPAESSESAEPAPPAPAVPGLRRAAATDAVADPEDAPSPASQATSQAGVPAATTSPETPDTDDDQGSGTKPGYELVPLRIPPGPRLHPSLTRYTWRSRFRDRRREMLTAVLAIVVLAVVAIAGMHIFSSLSHGSGASTTDGSGAAHQAPRPRAVAAGPAVADGAKDHAASAPARHKPAKGPQPVPVRQLPVSLAEAFGPGGPADGDNPANAMNAVRPGAAGPWTTQWYATATFGQLKSGTGLLLDMGRAVTVTRAAINLGAGSGADLQLRAGKEAGSLHAVTSAAGVGGDVVLHLHAPVRARYLLVWFTQLPSAANGQYQASVYHITIVGRP